MQLYIGQADYRVGEKGAWRDPGQLDRQLALNDKYARQRQHPLQRQARSARTGSARSPATATGHYATPALVPADGAAAGRAARRAAQLAGAAAGAARSTLTGRPARKAPAASWALYRVDGAAAALVATGRAGAQVADPAPPAGPATYCLSGLDRSGNEGPLSARDARPDAVGDPRR